MSDNQNFTPTDTNAFKESIAYLEKVMASHNNPDVPGATALDKANFNREVLRSSVEAQILLGVDSGEAAILESLTRGGEAAKAAWAALFGGKVPNDLSIRITASLWGNPIFQQAKQRFTNDGASK